MLKPLFYIILLNILTISVVGQDTLPALKVRNKSGKVIISWTNPYDDVVLINIQRSSDSLKNFKTILTVADPNAITNGYLDAKAPNTSQFYRLFVQQSQGKFFFTDAYKPFLDTAKAKPKSAAPPVVKQKETVKQETPKTENQAVIPRASESTLQNPPASTVIKTSSTVGPVEKQSQPEKITNTKLKFSNTRQIGDTQKIEAPKARELKPPPAFVYTNGQGQVVVVLPEEKRNLYTLKFFTESGTPVFTLNKIRDTHLTIEKTNFHSAGWYRCDLYENDKFRERYRVNIPKD
jgi:hypothetical protein